jgi:uncharacterized protein
VAEFLYLLEPARREMPEQPTDEERAVVREHFDHLTRMLEDGRLILAGRTLTAGSILGMVVFEAESEDAAKETMANDPAVAKGVMRATLHPYRVALARGRPR